MDSLQIRDLCLFRAKEFKSAQRWKLLKVSRLRRWSLIPRLQCKTMNDLRQKFIEDHGDLMNFSECAPLVALLFMTMSISQFPEAASEWQHSESALACNVRL